MQGFKDSLAFRGRLSRLGYWSAQFMYSVAAGLVVIMAMVVAIAGAPRWVALLCLAPLAIVLLAFVGAAARRLHDRNKSAWWLIVFWLAPIVLLALAFGLAVADAPLSSSARTGLVLAGGMGSALLSIWGAGELVYSNGKPGANRFGPAPL